METRVLQAATRAGEHIDRAGARGASFAERCVAYLEAAETAIDGLETEYDELLVEAKFCDVTDPRARDALDKRIDSYLHIDRLRLRLNDALVGLRQCLQEGRRTLVPEVAGRLGVVLASLTDYLASLEETGLSCRASGTGVAVGPLMEIQGALRDEALHTAEGQKSLRRKVEMFQRDPGKDGLLERTGQIRHAIEALRLALAHPGDESVLLSRSPVIFIGHSHQDEGIARGLIDVLETALPVAPTEIRATSVPGYKLRAGSRVAEQLQQDIAKVQVVLGLVTRRLFASPYVLFELGAAWGLGKPIFPLVVPGIDLDFDRVLGPIASVHRIQLSNIPDCHQLVDDVAHAIARDKVVGVDARTADKVQRLVRLVSGAEPVKGR